MSNFELAALAFGGMFVGAILYSIVRVISRLSRDEVDPSHSWSDIARRDKPDDL